MSLLAGETAYILKTTMVIRENGMIQILCSCLAIIHRLDLSQIFKFPLGTTIQPIQRLTTEAG